MSKIEDAIDILTQLGLPKAQQNERSALTLLALANVKEEDSWAQSQQQLVRIHDILIFIKNIYRKEYAENTRETIRRQSIHQFEQAGIVIRNPDDLDRPTNSPNTVYSINEEALRVIKTFRTDEWSANLQEFIEEKGRLIERYEKRKRSRLISVSLPEGKIKFSPGNHNKLQVKILTEFRTNFCPQSMLVYVGDTSKKLLYLDEDILDGLLIPITKHDKLPDVVLFNKEKNVLFLIEAVTSHGPLSPKRQIELEKTLENCSAKKVYISTFPDFKEFKKHIQDVAWETEVWISSNPGHMIHFNGPKFFTLYDT